MDWEGAESKSLEEKNPTKSDGQVESEGDEEAVKEEADWNINKMKKYSI